VVRSGFAAIVHLAINLMFHMRPRHYMEFGIRIVGGMVSVSLVV
jgi:hypothetical protein